MKQKEITLSEAHKQVRDICELKQPSSVAFFTNAELEIVLSKIGCSKDRLPKWWKKTVAGPNHPGKQNHIMLLATLHKQKMYNRIMKKPAKAKKCFTKTRDFSQWVLDLAKTQSLPNLDGFNIEELEDRWVITLDVRK